MCAFMTEVKQGWERILYGVDYMTPRLNGGGGGGGGVDRLAGPFTSSLLLLHTFSLTSTELKDFFFMIKKIL